MRAGHHEESGPGAAGQQLKAQEEQIIPILEEELEIGKREVEAGGVRVSTRVSAVPVERSVTVREEQVRVERRAVDRPFEEGGPMFEERSLEMRAHAEEPYLTKRARVVEEIRVRKDRSEHEEKIREKVRRTDVNIAELSAPPNLNRALPVSQR